MKKDYEKPEVIMLSFDYTDVITASEGEAVPTATAIPANHNRNQCPGYSPVDDDTGGNTKKGKKKKC